MNQGTSHMYVALACAEAVTRITSRTSVQDSANAESAIHSGHDIHLQWEHPDSGE